MTARYATPKPGSRPISSTRCACLECGPGPGIDFDEIYRLRYGTSYRNADQDSLVLRQAGIPLSRRQGF